MSELLLVEDVALLLLADDTGWMRGQYHEWVLAGALATELAIRGRIRLTEKGERDVRPGRVVVSDASSTDDAILDQALVRLAGRPVRWRSTTVQLLRKNVKRLVLERLVERGFVEAREHRVLGLVPITVYPAVSFDYEQRLRSGLFAVLARNEEPTVREACIIALLSAVNMADKVIAEDVSTVNRRAIRKRAKEMRKVHWAAETAYRLIQNQQSAAAG
ncbi:GPP34 family phosphoprotein [Ammonicoccus fulvus]|uniref:GPP34 family phosphoprotein n=1 Tax=Ammonicoccus fulvus TaxID=3138240 RepID=A0ABZ3FLC1_9ACTN